MKTIPTTVDYNGYRYKTIVSLDESVAFVIDKERGEVIFKHASKEQARISAESLDKMTIGYDFWFQYKWETEDNSLFLTR